MKKIKSQSGQALITILFFMVLGMSIIAAASLILSNNMTSSNTAELGSVAYYAAESGAEEGILRLLRNPSFSGTVPTYSVGPAQTSIVINSGTVISTGTYNNLTRKIQITTSYSNGVFSITSWKEIN